MANSAQYTKLVALVIYTTLWAINVVATFFKDDSTASSQAGIANKNGFIFFGTLTLTFTDLSSIF